MDFAKPMKHAMFTSGSKTGPCNHRTLAQFCRDLTKLTTSFARCRKLRNQFSSYYYLLRQTFAANTISAAVAH